MSLLRSLQWLPISLREKARIFTMTCKAFHKTAPHFFSDLISLLAPGPCFLRAGLLASSLFPEYPRQVAPGGPASAAWHPLFLVVSWLIVHLSSLCSDVTFSMKPSVAPEFKSQFPPHSSPSSPACVICSF